MVNNIPRKRWIYIIPAVFLINVFAFMDRMVISIALPGGMMKDLAMNATLAGFAGGVVSIGLLFLQVQGGQLAQKGKAKNFLIFSIFAWSILSVVTGFVQNAWQLFLVRFLLGLAEGGLSPAVVTLITFWFPDKNGERNRANSFYYSGNSFALIIMGPIAGIIMAAASWRELFIILGIVSALTGLIWIALITERPENAKWLSREEREYIVTMIEEEQEIVKKVSTVEVKGDKLPLGILLRNKNVWLLMIISFSVTFGQFGFGIWMPTMIKNVTKAGILGVGLLSTIPNIVVLIGLWTWSYLTKKIKDRRITTAMPALLFGIILIAGTFTTGDAYLGFFMIVLASFFLQGGLPSFSTIPSLLFVKELDGPARGLIGLASSVGAFAGPYIVGFLITLFGTTNAGMYIIGAFLLIGFLTAFALPENQLVRKTSDRTISM